MREIRARIAERHGIDLSPQQIQELAARRLEAILDPRTVKPSLLEQLRKSAGEVGAGTTSEAGPAYTFEDATLYESHNGLLRFLRRLLNPALKLFFNPNPLIQALNVQARLNAGTAKREDERDRRQAEWNALHYTLLQRLVLELSRSTVDSQGLAARVESLIARIDFNDRRLRTLEGAPSPAPAPRHVDSRAGDTARAGDTPRMADTARVADAARTTDARAAESARPTDTAWPTGSVAAGATPSNRMGGGDGSGDASPEAVRRRRRRRRGRRSGPLGESGPAIAPQGRGDVADGHDPDGEREPQEHQPASEPQTASAEDGSVAAGPARSAVHDDAPAGPPASDTPAASSGPGWDPPDR